MSDFLWYEAAHFLSLSPEERAAGWPDAFTLEKLAWLQFPPVGDDVANNESKRKRKIIFQVLQDAVYKGDIAVENREKKEDVFERKLIERCFLAEKRDSQKYETYRGCYIPRGAGYTPMGFSRNSLYVEKTVKTGEKTVTYPVIYRHSFAEWWGRQEETGSKYIAAWLKAGGQQYAEKSKEKQKGGAMENALTNEHVAANPAPQTPDESPILPDFPLSQAGVKMTFNEKTCGIGEDKWRGFFSREDGNGLIDAKTDHTKGKPIYSSKKVALWLVQEGKCEMRQIKKALGEDSKPEAPPDKWSQLKVDQ